MRFILSSKHVKPSKNRFGSEARSVNETGAQSPMVSFDHVGMMFGRKTPIADTRKQVLHDVCLDIDRGAILCLLGPSGCGKTTMVNLVIGNLVPTEGTVRVMGEKAPYPEARLRVGCMPQEDALYEDITAEENLRFFGAMAGMNRADIDRRINDMLAFTRLEDDRKRMVGSFSGGMKRRLSLAVAMLHEPDLLVLDEPTVGLDPDHRRRIWDEFEKLRKAGTTLLVTTHVMDEASRCGEVAMLYNGHIIAHDTPANILARTATADIEDAFLSLMDAAQPAAETKGGDADE